jgi:hypothetical protein
VSDYTIVGRDLADALRRWARDRRDEDKKEIATLQSELCRIRRAELSAAPSADPDASNSGQ